jgi:transposase
MTVSASKRAPQRIELEHMPCVFPNAAGFDIGSPEMGVALPPDRPAPTVRAFSTFTTDLKQLMAWVRAHRIATVAMESTGIYWIPIYEMLEEAGIRVSLVNARHFKIVPGRKTDDNDAQWLQKLHSLGLLQASFRPDEERCVLRCLLRHRAQLVEHRSPHILHMQKALKLMNIQLPEVLSDVTGVTGLAILRASVAGERRGHVLAKLRRPECKKTEQDIVEALTGTWRDEHLFVLQQSLDLYDYYTSKIAECDTRIDQQFSAMKPRFEVEGDPPAPPKSRTKKGSKSKNKPSYNCRAHLWRILGVDLVEVTGISESIAQTVISEIGTDMSRFPTVKHFCSWLGLAPHNDISGGRILRSRVLKVHNRAGQAFRQAAQSCARSQSIFGAFFRAIRGKRGAETAVVATAHKIARVVYHRLKYREAFTPESSQALDQKRRQRELHNVQRRAKALGYKLAPALV